MAGRVDRQRGHDGLESDLDVGAMRVRRSGPSLVVVSLLVIVAVLLAWSSRSLFGGRPSPGDRDAAVLPTIESIPVQAEESSPSAQGARVETESIDDPVASQQDAVFSGWVVDTRGNPRPDLRVSVWLLRDVVTAFAPSQHGCRTGPAGAFQMELPAAWRDMALGVGVSSEDHRLSAQLVACATTRQTLVVAGPSDRDSRIDGVVRIRGPLDQGHWLMPVERARALVAGGDFADGTIRLGDVGLNLKRPAWEPHAFGLAVITARRAPAAYRRFADGVAFDGWLAGRPEIEVAQCVVRVPAVGDRAVSEIEFGLRQVPQFGVVWWGTEAVDEGRVELCAESGTAFIVVGKIAGGQDVAIGSCLVDCAKPADVEWAMTLPGPHVLDVPVDLSLATMVRQFDVQAVPILAGGERVQARRAWRTARGLVDDAAPNPLTVRLTGLAAGRYELQVVVDRRAIASAEAVVPGDAPVLSTPNRTSVVFALPMTGQLQALDVCYLLDGSTGAPTTARLPTGIGAFEGFALQCVPPGDYRFCLRYQDRYAEGRFTVAPGASVVSVPVDAQPVEQIEGIVDAVGSEGPCIVSVVMPHVAAPWLCVSTNEAGAFRLAVPLRYLDRGLSARWGGVQCQLQQTSAGHWTRHD
ncbi:MAG: hypothetical protein H6838_04165 [Planctomycetes bacterium]|nr:hypothetical protein [Planctomycetota bacterium]